VKIVYITLPSVTIMSLTDPTLNSCATACFQQNNKNKAHLLHSVLRERIIQAMFVHQSHLTELYMIYSETLNIKREAGKQAILKAQ
jgi:hypothetical protein